MRDYRKIDAWKLVDDLAVDVYRKTKGFPREERFGLTSQLRRASHSVPANIAEGSARRTKKDYLHFLYMARASLSETQYFVHLAARLGYLGELDRDALMASIEASFKRLHGLIRAVEKEAGLLGRGAAAMTSALVLCASRLFFSIGP